MKIYEMTKKMLLAITWYESKHERLNESQRDAYRSRIEADSLTSVLARGKGGWRFAGEVRLRIALVRSSR